MILQYLHLTASTFLIKLILCDIPENYRSNSTYYPCRVPQMLAVRMHEYGEPDVLKLETCDIPPPPNNDEVLILVKACPVYPWDVKIRKDQYARNTLQLPAILGQEVSGIVIMTGKNVNHVKVGDKVFAKLPHWEGGYAQLALANGIDTYHLPEKFTFEQGAILYHLYFGAWRGLIYKGEAKANQSILIVGANRGNGLAAIQVAKAYGLRVVATCGNKPGFLLVKEFGADFVVDHTLTDFRDHALKLNDGELFDLILEDYQVENCFDADHHYMKPFTGKIMRHTGIEVAGSGEAGRVYGFNLFMQTDTEKKFTWEAISEGIREGWYTPRVQRYYLLHQVRKAHIDALNKDAPGDSVFTGIDQHEMLIPFMSEELRTNCSNLVTPALRDLVEIYHAPDEEYLRYTNASADTRRYFLSNNVFYQLYGGTTVKTSPKTTDFFSEMWYKYSTNTIDLDMTHDDYFENYLRDYVWWTMPPNRTKPTSPVTSIYRRRQLDYLKKHNGTTDYEYAAFEYGI